MVVVVVVVVVVSIVHRSSLSSFGFCFDEKLNYEVCRLRVKIYFLVVITRNNNIWYKFYVHHLMYGTYYVISKVVK